ncbi:MAG: hypothetical protein GXO22_07350 [Aquificae bacterium]|nr:hypothetical protein [Aquificota bacterium]
MNSSENWTVLQSKYFERTVVNLIKNSYRKNPKGKKKFLELLKSILMELTNNPYCKNSYPEPSPKNMLKEDEELRKYYFLLPDLKGAVAQGRIIYKINKKEKSVYLLMAYTHKQYEKRPPDDLIRKADNQF